MADLNRTNSRFSSFRTFKFPSAKSKPPPVPPKDPFYLPNRSVPSITSSPPSLPASPKSPQYPQQQPSPGPSQSTMSLASSTASLSPPPVLEPVQNTKRQRGFFRFPKRNLKSRSQASHSPGSSVASPSTEENISLPWGFQHHAHVDESLSGLPPSWSASLADVGYTEAEIAAINARRTATRSPTWQFGYDGRPFSPATGNSVMLHPAPRSTSLLNSILGPTQPTPISSLSHHNAGSSISNGGKSSTESSRQACDPHLRVLEISAKADAQHMETRNNLIKNHTNQTLSSYHTSHTFRSRNSSFASAADSSIGSTNSPRTKPAPTKTTSADSPSAWASPPINLSYGKPLPAASLPPPYGFLQQPVDQHPSDSQRNKSISSQSSHQSNISNGHRPRTTQETRDKQDIDVFSDESAPSQSSGSRTTLTQRLATLPPRLSLVGSDNIGDLSSWSEALLSAIPTEMNSTSSLSASRSSSSSKFAAAQASRAPPPLSLSSTQRDQPPLPSYTYPTPPDSETGAIRPVAAILQETSGNSNGIVVVKEYHEDDGFSHPPTITTPLWDELMCMVQQPSPGLYVPAMNEINSPTLPITPAETGGRFRGSSFIQMDKDSSEIATGDGEAEGGDGDDDDGSLSDEMERDPNRDSNTSTASVSTVTAVTIVRKASLATRAIANVIRPLQAKPRGDYRSEDMQKVVEEDENVAPLSAVSSSRHSDFLSESSTASSVSATGQSSNWGSPQSSPSTSEPGSASSNTPVENYEGSFHPEADPTQGPKTPAYLDFLEPSPIPSKTDFEVDSGRIPLAVPKRLSVVEDNLTSPQVHMLAANVLPTPVTSAHRYPGWLSAVVAPLEEFIDDRTEPRHHYVDLQEIAEGESGSVYLARVVKGHKLQIQKAPTSKSGDGRVEYVAIKNIPISPSGSPKLLDLERELKLLKGVQHQFVLGMDALYVDLVEDSLWIRMELMERSLADVVNLVVEGLMVQERMIARFASDVLLALKYLQTERIAHRDVRSDNLLLNKEGLLKISDFSNAVRIAPDQPTCSDTAGVLFWQAPEVRAGPYDPLKVDVWSLGATAWEMAQAVPPFSDILDPRQMGTRLPPLSQPEIYGRTFHEFLSLCSEPASSRPGPSELLDTAFVRNACGRQVIIQLLAQCKTIEDRMAQNKLDES